MNLTIDSNVQNILYNGNDVQKLIFNGNVVWEKTPAIDYEKEYMTFEAETSGTITLTRNNTSTTVPSGLKYRKNNGNWTLVTNTIRGYTNTLSISVNVGDKVQWYGTNSKISTNASYYMTFGGTAKVKLYGNMYSLAGGENFATSTATVRAMTSDGFHRLFYGMKITDASNLIIGYNSIGTGSCYAMFYGCTEMVYGPKILPITSLANNCYNMMFYGCSKLEEAPELPATTLYAQCYNQMFQNCTKLNYIKAMFTTAPGSSYTNNWLSGVASTGIFVKNINATWTTTGASGVPSGWTIQRA